jgi:NitT/TauT family transport system permease protein
MRKFCKGFFLSIIAPLILLLAWTVMSYRIDNRVILPKPEKVLANLVDPMQNFVGLGTLPRNIEVSLFRVLLGYLSGLLTAVPLGLVMGYNRKLNTLFSSLISLLKPVPSLAWVPLILGWFGIASLATLFEVPRGPDFVYYNNFKLSMIFIIALGTFFPVISNVIFGVQNVPLVWLDSARVLGASKTQIFTKILLPAAAPTIIHGMRSGLSTAWACLIAAEMLPGGLSGLGYMITHAYELARTDVVVVGIICIGSIGALLDGIFRFIADRYFSWSNRV